jgi:predicted phosphodiesterase
MAAHKVITDEQLREAAALYKEHGVKETARRLGLPLYKVEYLVNSAVAAGWLPDRSRPLTQKSAERLQTIDGRLQTTLEDGYILVGSDCHYFPGIVSTAHRAFVKLCKEIRPALVVLNGDVFDGSTISRHPRIGWDSKPTVAQELAAVDERTREIEEAAGTRELFWLLGNHDARYETFLAAHAPEFQNVDGFTLKSHFPAWKPGWSLHINDDIVIKHSFRGGVHATYNNTLHSGKTLVTGHLHKLQVTPFSDYNGRRFGVDCGTMAAPYGPQFSDYTQLNPVNWASGFVILTLWRGRLLWPSIVHVLDEVQGLVEWGVNVWNV